MEGSQKVIASNARMHELFAGAVGWLRRIEIVDFQK
jgi:hypothetical protein